MIYYINNIFKNYQMKVLLSVNIYFLRFVFNSNSIEIDTNSL